MLNESEELELLYLDRLERIERARSSLLDFTLETNPAYLVNWHHAFVAEYLDAWVEGRIQNLMLFMPPQNGKSELVSRRMPAYIFGRHPGARIVAASYGDELASAMNLDVQKVMSTPEYRAIFPDTRLKPDAGPKAEGQGYARTAHRFDILKHDGGYISAGVGGAITGKSGDYLIVDDPFKNDDEAQSPTIREKVWNWYTTTFKTRRRSDSARTLITQTRWHEDDLAGRAIEVSKLEDGEKFTVVSIPAIADEDYRELPPIPQADGTLKPMRDPRAKGEPLWPSRYSLKFLLTTRVTAGHRKWSALYQQSPTVEAGQIVQRGWFKYWTELPARFDQIIQSWDCAFKDTDKSDFVVGQLWGKKGADKFLIDQVRGRMDFTATVAAIRNMSARYPTAYVKLVEDKANGPAVIATLKKEISGIIAVEPQGSKTARLSAVSPAFEAGNVYIPHPSLRPWVHDYVEEMVAFPNGRNDDQVDSSSQALIRFQLTGGGDFPETLIQKRNAITAGTKSGDNW